MTKGAPNCCVPARRDGARPHHGRMRQGQGYQGEWDRDFIQIPGGTAEVGTDRPLIHDDGEGPPRKVRITPFRLSKSAASNAQFAAFVKATGYVTDAERFGWSLVFRRFADQTRSYQRVSETPWWCRVDGADWAHPYGPHSDLTGLADHPVIHVSWHDANAFAAWMGGTLPTEAQWEHAARGGRHGRYPWGDAEPNDADFLPCNIWQGQFPDTDTGADAHIGTAPTISFAANGYGFYNMSGNVWEWTSENFRVRSLKRAAKVRNTGSAMWADKLLKGGSFLCHKSYCYRYRIAARTAATPDSSTGHMGFRVALPEA